MECDRDEAAAVLECYFLAATEEFEWFFVFRHA